MLKSTEWDFILLNYFLLPSARKNCCSPAQVRTIVLKQSPQACRFMGKNSKQEFSGFHNSLIQHFSCPTPGLTLSTCSRSPGRGRAEAAEPVCALRAVHSPPFITACPHTSQRSPLEKQEGNIGAQIWSLRGQEHLKVSRGHQFGVQCCVDAASRLCLCWAVTWQGFCPLE